jgi:putative YpdA family bacillithiol system oxidoreductase
MDTLFSLLIGLAVTFFFLRRYLKNLASSRASGPKKEPPSVPSTPCPRCSKPVLKGSAFCPSCGAPLALWTVQSAAIKTARDPAAKSGKPRPVINAMLCIGCGSCVDACPETGTLEIVKGKAILAHSERCTGQARCAESCPTSAITLAVGDTLQTLRVPRVSENFETNIDGVFIVGELGGMGLIKTAVNEGRIVVDYIRARFGDSRGSAEEAEYDLAIVGAGPAGLSASLTAKMHGLRYITLEQGDVASTIRQYPRHKFLMAEPVTMPLYGQLYVADGTKEALLGVWESIVANTGVEIHTNERVKAVQRTRDATFSVTTVRSTYLARCVVLAMGKRGIPRRLGVPGEDLAKVAHKLIEAESYCGCNILVVGGGDSAVEAALALSKASRNHVTLSYRRAGFERVRERNRAMLAEAEKQRRIQVLRNSEVIEIIPDSVVLNTPAGSVEIPNDYVFSLIGGEPPEEFLLKTGVEIVEKMIGEVPCPAF